MLRASRRKYHMVYKTTCKITGRFYIGLHSSDSLEDDYRGSGVRLLKSIRKHGKENHTREILELFATRVDASNKEKQILTKEFREDPLCMNCAGGGEGAVDRSACTKETRMKISQANTGKVRTPEMCERYRACKVGIPFSEEHKKKLSAKKLGKPISDKQRANLCNGQSARCTIDGVKIYPSKVALAQELGHGKSGARSPDFRYVDSDRYVQSLEQRRKLSQTITGVARPDLVKEKLYRPCTVDGEIIFKSVAELIHELGYGKKGRRSASFRYV